MNKKILFAISIFLAFLVSCKNPAINDVEYGNVSISTFQESARLITPNSDFDFEAVEWKITFILNEEEILPKYNDGKYQLPVGTYKIVADGVVSNGTDTVYYTGSVSNIVISAGENYNIKIPVALKKTTEGIGNLRLSILFSDDAKISSYILSLKNAKTEDQIVRDYPEVDPAGNTIELSEGNIPSGFYYLSINCVDRGQRRVVVIEDSLVEIIDGYTTNGSINADFAVVRTYYATTEESPYNGSSESYPVNLSTLFDRLGSDEKWTEAKIYIKASEDISEVEVPQFEDRNIYVYHGLDMIYYKNRSVPVPNAIIDESNYATFTKDNLVNNMTLIIEDSVYDEVTVNGTVQNRLNTFFTAISNANKNITVDMSGYTGSISKNTVFSSDPRVIILPDNLTELNESAFSGTTKLTEIRISETNENYKIIDGNLYKVDGNGNPTVIVRYLPTNTAESFDLPSTVTEVFGCAFYSCSSLKTIDLSNIVTIGTCAFWAAGVENVTFRDLTSMGTNIFRKTENLATIVIPSGITGISEYAFSHSKIKTVVIEGNSVNIAGAAFQYSSIENIIFTGSGNHRLGGGNGVFDGVTTTNLHLIAKDISYLSAFSTSSVANCIYGPLTTPTAAYDLLFKDGTFISSDIYARAKDYDMFDAPLGMLVNFTTTDGVSSGYIIGLEKESYKSLAWASASSTGYSTNFEAIVDTWVTNAGPQDSDGSDNWSEICTVDTSASDNMDKYPAFNYALNFGSAATADAYKEGWYLPSLGEVQSVIRVNKDTINTALTSMGYANLSGEILTSNQGGDGATSAVHFDIDAGNTWQGSKSQGYTTVAIRKYSSGS